jgi:hypothetical protein
LFALWSLLVIYLLLVLFDATTTGIKGRTCKFYNNIMIKYVLKMVIEAVTLFISTTLIIFLSHFRIYRIKNVKKILWIILWYFYFWAFICLGFYSAVMMLLYESGFGFVITMGVGIELYVHIGHEINDQYHCLFYLAIYVGLCLFIARATIHY